VAVPDERGRYLRTDRSVVITPCPMCRAIKGEPCKASFTHDGYSSTTHAVRRTAARRFSGRQDDLIDPVDPSRPPSRPGDISLIEPRPV
jgi:hypothetical protein